MGHYVKNNLVIGETIEYETTYHWITFVSKRAFITLFIAPLIDRWTDEFAITNKRVILKTGLIKRDTIELNLSKVESVNVNQSVLGRILGFGSITVIGTGGTQKILSNIKQPIKFRKKIQELS